MTRSGIQGFDATVVLVPDIETRFRFFGGTSRVSDTPDAAITLPTAPAKAYTIAKLGEEEIDLPIPRGFTSPAMDHAMLLKPVMGNPIEQAISAGADPTKSPQKIIRESYSG